MHISNKKMSNKKEMFTNKTKYSIIHLYQFYICNKLVKESFLCSVKIVEKNWQMM